MKQVLFLFLIAGMVSCNSGDQTKTTDTQVKSATTREEPKMDYAYTIEHPDNWVAGPKENTKMVLQSLKDFENGDIDKSLTAFADSVELRFNEMEGKFSKDSIASMFKHERSGLKAMQIDMHDFESVKSKDGKEEYVSHWYTQKLQGQNGAWDSVSVMDDLRIQNGKVVLIDEKTRKFAKKKM
jgi:hypothetical protein